MLSYTIKYSKVGIYQYARFSYSEGKLISYNFNPSWTIQSEVPSLEGLNDINDILKVIQDFSYANDAEIILLNGNIPEYDKSIDDMININAIEYNKFISSMFLEFYKYQILPIVRKNKWKHTESWLGVPILVKVDDTKEGEYINVDNNERDMMLISNICFNFLKQVVGYDMSLFNLNDSYCNVRHDSFRSFISYIDIEHLIELDVYIVNDETK